MKLPSHITVLKTMTAPTPTPTKAATSSNTRTPLGAAMRKTANANSPKLMENPLVPVGIVVAMIVVGVFVYFNFIAQSPHAVETATAKTYITQTLTTALEHYRDDVGEYPSTMQSLRALESSPPGARNWKGPYLDSKTIALDPWKKDYSYEYPGTHNGKAKPDIWSNGPDKIAGTDDDVTNW